MIDDSRNHEREDYIFLFTEEKENLSLLKTYTDYVLSAILP
jgi:hypothetical protein